MTQAQRPLCVCPACGQNVPRDVEEIHYFAQERLRPEADDVGTRLNELADLTAEIESLFRLLVDVRPSALDDNHLYHCLRLGWDLATEARRRVEIASKAWDPIDERYLNAEWDAKPREERKPSPKNGRKSPELSEDEKRERLAAIAELDRQKQEIALAPAGEWRKGKTAE